VDEARARPAIEAFLVNQRKTEVVQKDIKSLRDAAKIDYIGKFAGGPAAAASAAAVAAPAVAVEAPAAAASGLNAADISKGMGLK